MYIFSLFYVKQLIVYENRRGKEYSSYIFLQVPTSTETLWFVRCSVWSPRRWVVRGFRPPLGRTTVLGYFLLRGQEERSQEPECLFHLLQRGTWSHSEHILSSAWDNLAHTEYALAVHAVYFSARISKILGFLQYDFWLTGKESDIWALRKGSRILKRS